MPMATEMKPSAEVRAFVEQHESLRLAVYCCPGGEWTQGWGHTKGITADSPPVSVTVAKRWLSAMDVEIAGYGAIRKIF